MSGLLSTHWQHQIKPSSRGLLAPNWWSFCAEDVPRYPVRHDMNVLGQLISWNGAVVADVEHQVRGVRASFSSNSGSLEASRLSVAARLRLVATSDLATIRSAWARCPWSKSRCDDLDRLQKELVGRVVRVKLEDAESPEEFCYSRNGIIKAVAQEQGLWSHHYTLAVVKWWEHIQRNTVGTWHGNLLTIMTTEELVFRRLLRGDNRPHTRRMPGGVAARWCQAAIQFADKIPVRKKRCNSSKR